MNFCLRNKLWRRLGCGWCAPQQGEYLLEKEACLALCMCGLRSGGTRTTVNLLAFSPDLLLSPFFFFSGLCRLYNIPVMAL